MSRLKEERQFERELLEQRKLDRELKEEGKEEEEQFVTGAYAEELKRRKEFEKKLNEQEKEDQLIAKQSESGAFGLAMTSKFLNDTARDRTGGGGSVVNRDSGSGMGPEKPSSVLGPARPPTMAQTNLDPAKSLPSGSDNIVPWAQRRKDANADGILESPKSKKRAASPSR